jgi:ketosteroid isomerase-like protein
MEDRGASEAEVEAIHNELRALRKGLTDAVLAGDVEKQLAFVTEDLVITWQNGEVVRGRAAVKEFLLKNQGAASKVFQGYKKHPEPTDLTILYGENAGISHGTSVGRYKLLGKEFELENHWTATLVKENDRWRIASYHVSANILDNPLLNGVKSLAYTLGGVAFVVGLALGWLVFRNRTRTTTPPAA